MSRAYTQLEMEPAYGVSHWAIKVLYDISFRGEITGLEHLPAVGGFIVAANHSSHLDPPIVGLHLSRQVSFFARKTLWKPGIPARWLDAVGTIPVDRDGGADVNAIRRVLQALNSGKAVIVFPEGTRSPDGRLQRPKGGIGLIACKSGVPVVPARVFGSFAAYGRGGALRAGLPIDVAYGPALLPEQYDRPQDGKERYMNAAGRIMQAIAAIEPERRPVV
ncbi:MAG: lysophospholipid acyltransferase family protein [Opitutaceae bacterium]